MSITISQAKLTGPAKRARQHLGVQLQEAQLRY